MFSQDEEFTVEVYELSDLKKEYDLTVAQLSLLQLMERQALNPNVPSSAQETVAQLVNMKGYELAISVARSQAKILNKQFCFGSRGGVLDRFVLYALGLRFLSFIYILYIINYKMIYVMI